MVSCTQKEKKFKEPYLFIDNKSLKIVVPFE